jgi:hypothetical protein
VAEYLVVDSEGSVEGFIRGKSLREAAAELPVGKYEVHTVSVTRAVEIREVTSTDIVVGEEIGSWDTAGEEE